MQPLLRLGQFHKKKDKKGLFCSGKGRRAEKMLSVIGEICIFIIIAKTLLCLVPGESYAKYVSVLLGMLLILRIMEPILSFLGDRDISQEIEAAGKSLALATVEKDMELQEKEGEECLTQEIEKELKAVIEACEEEYQVERAELDEETACLRVMLSTKKETASYGQDTEVGERILIERITITEEKEEADREKEENRQKEEERLREKYSACTGIEKENIRIVFQ